MQQMQFARLELCSFTKMHTFQPLIIEYSYTVFLFGFQIKMSPVITAINCSLDSLAFSFKVNETSKNMFDYQETENCELSHVHTIMIIDNQFFFTWLCPCKWTIWIEMYTQYTIRQRDTPVFINSILKKSRSSHFENSPALCLKGSICHFCWEWEPVRQMSAVFLFQVWI